jgi:hypothetical protein
VGHGAVAAVNRQAPSRKNQFLLTESYISATPKNHLRAETAYECMLPQENKYLWLLKMAIGNMVIDRLIG